MKIMIKAVSALICASVLLCGCAGGGGNKGDETGNGGELMGEPVTENCTESRFPSYIPSGIEYNVKDYGATGDGVTDDSAAVLEALGKIKDDVGGTLYFPAGQYRLAQKMTFGAECIVAFDDGACIIADEPVKVNGYIESGSHILFKGEGSYQFSLKNPYVTPVWFGAVGDGQTDDTAAFRTAISASGEIYIPATGAGYVVGDITLAKSVRIAGLSSGDNQKPTLIGKEGISNLFAFTADNIYISNLRIEMGGTGKASVFFFDTSERGKTDHKLYDIDVYGAYCAVTDAGVVENLVINTLVDNVNCYDCRGTALYLRCFWGFVFFRNLTIDSSGTKDKYGVSADFPSVVLENNAGCVFQNMDIIGDGRENSDQNGFLYRNNIATWMDDCRFKNLGGSAVYCSGSSSFLYFSNLTAEGCRGDAFRFKGITYPKIHNLTADGKDGKNCILIDSCKYAQVSGCRVSNAAENGILVSSSEGTSITDCEAKNCGQYGIGASDSRSTSCVGCTGDGNREGNFASGIVVSD